MCDTISITPHRKKQRHGLSPMPMTLTVLRAESETRPFHRLDSGCMSHEQRKFMQAPCQVKTHTYTVFLASARPPPRTNPSHPQHLCPSKQLLAPSSPPPQHLPPPLPSTPLTLPAALVPLAQRPTSSRPIIVTVISAPLPICSLHRRHRTCKSIRLPPRRLMTQPGARRNVRWKTRHDYILP